MIGSRFFPAVGRVPTWSFTCHQMKKCQPELTCQYHGRADHIRTASAYSCYIYNKSVPSSSSSSSSLPSSSNSPLHSAALQSSRWCSSSIYSAPREPSGLLECSDEKTQEIAEKDFIVIQDFITKDEEESLLREVERFLKKVRYEYDHWDNAIHGFRETEKSRWSEVNSPIIQRIRDQAFPADSSQLSLVHVLDLAQNGYIKPHVDSVKYCGSTIAGLCLLSPAVMRLVHTENSNQWVNALLNSRSLYIMRDKMRYDYTHEILKEEESIFRGNPVPRRRRISIMCRAEVSQSS